MFVTTAVPLNVSGDAQHAPRGGLQPRGGHQFKVMAFDRATGRTVWERIAREAEPLERDAGEVALRSLGEHRDLRDQIRTGLEVSERLTIAAAALVTGPNSACPAVGDE